jgi:hypothetical protein
MAAKRLVLPHHFVWANVRSALWQRRSALWQRRSALWQCRFATWQRRSARWQCRSARWQRQFARWQCRSARWQCRSATWQCQSARWQRRSAMGHLQSAMGQIDVATGQIHSARGPGCGQRSPGPRRAGPPSIGAVLDSGGDRRLGPLHSAHQRRRPGRWSSSTWEWAVLNDREGSHHHPRRDASAPRGLDLKGRPCEVRLAPGNEAVSPEDRPAKMGTLGALASRRLFLSSSLGLAVVGPAAALPRAMPGLRKAGPSALKTALAPRQ